jgi:hypothetical protein
MVLSTAAAMAEDAKPPSKPGVFKLTYGACSGAEMFGSNMRAQLGTKKPEGLTAEPKYKAKPQYGSLNLAADGKGKPFLVAVDKSEPTQRNFDILYIDRDRDGDLAEEKPIAIVRGKSDFELAISVKGKKINRLLSASTHMMSESASMLMLRDRGAWHGKARVGKANLDIILVDGNGNGVFNEAFQMPEGAKSMPGPPDMFLTKPMNAMAPDYGAFAICPATLAFDGKLYNAAVAADGSNIAFSPFTGKTAVLTAPEGMSAILATGDRITTVTTRDGKMLVPAGKIRPFIYSCRQKDKTGQEWVLLGQPNFKAKPINAPAGRSIAFPGGLPVKVGVKTSPAGKITAGSRVKLIVAVTDSSGQAVRISPLPGKGKPLAQSPTVIVVKQGEKVLLRGKCESG